MRCKQVVELMTAYLEGALSESERRNFELHIAGCDGCTEYLRQLRTSIVLTGRLAAQPVPAHIAQDLMRAFRDWRRN
jgi:anti-sigma factor RsiW